MGLTPPTADCRFTIADWLPPSPPVAPRAFLKSEIRNPKFQILLLLPLLLALTACHQRPVATPYAALGQGDFGSARVNIHNNMVDQRSDRQFILDRMRTGVLTLADGYPESAQTVFEPTYEMLRTQGINRDRTVASVVFHEGVRIWKGEPFEQALTMFYYGLTHAQTGSWDNARAASQNALFYLRDFRRPGDRDNIDAQELARRSLVHERAGQTDAEYLDHGYVARESDFTLGYLLNAVSNQQLGRDEEASDNFNYVVELNPELGPLVDAFRTGEYNTVLVVSWGLGPRKIAYGPDNALTRFATRYPSNNAGLRVQVGDRGGRSYDQVLDVNRMARDHRWNNMEDVRIAKSAIGRAMFHGGAITTMIGADRGSSRTAIAGLGVMLAGALTASGAQADTRYADVMPQRVYVIPLNLTEQDQPITLQVEGNYASRLVLRGLTAPRDGQAQLRYVRLVSRTQPTSTPPAWATSGRIVYSNPHTGATNGPQLPYILGGDCVRLPTSATMQDYHRSGHLLDLTTNDLRELYRQEDIRFEIEDQRGYADRHILEGGRSLVAPQPGTTGFMRLFGAPRPPYRPTSRDVADHAREENQRQRESLVHDDR
ncbi:hypothetical protein ACERK3_00825 [Phycisphaerales bacterium AB-hyl4]|uniref:Tetratricopeptide repeat protein n=1 Tax=Natronomicrosphaera hydrolytica TaxID=3242702 RepID=A0ABV4TZR6_9BACT